ncbi:anaerobic sulfite reductase subunit B [bacterium BMS3Abin07]|nr:anaerobic sulfite reductase subunit B [bacterium BMS3Abin07]GBE31751.1 anaerobic sulfite reductase subunit B [bacterium BMS3Bbin05]HDL20286.1 hydrogenase [Nitrospirota bacterium]HDO23381.1 hydrogenase [Nitrospirota bacterium]
MKRVNIYTPFRAEIKEIEKKTADVNLYRIALPKRIKYSPGQFFMVSVWGAGEVPISITSHSAFSDGLELCVRKAGFVTSLIYNAEEGTDIWLRGPYGNGFPLDIAGNSDIVLIAGGIGMAPLRPLIYEFTNRNKKYGNVKLVYGSKYPDDVIFRDEIEVYKQMGAKVIVSVDRKNGEWDGNVGFVTDFLGSIKADMVSAVAYVCGPEIMIKNVTRDLSLMGMPHEKIITTLEAHMKCGVGKCGHCYAGCKYICTDGPVFSYKEIREYQLMQAWEDNK